MLFDKMKQCISLCRQNDAFPRTFWTIKPVFFAAAFAMRTRNFQVVCCNHQLVHLHSNCHLYMAAPASLPPWPSPPLKNAKKPSPQKDEGLAVPPFLITNTIRSQTYGKGSSLRYVSLDNGENIPAPPTDGIRSAERFRSPFGIRGASVHTSHRLS